MQTADIVINLTSQKQFVKKLSRWWDRKCMMLSNRILWRRDIFSISVDTAPNLTHTDMSIR